MEIKIKKKEKIDFEILIKIIKKWKIKKKKVSDGDDHDRGHDDHVHDRGHDGDVQLDEL